MSLLSRIFPSLAPASPAPPPALAAVPAVDPVVALACKLLRKYEGCKLHPYRDTTGKWTIGWGTITIDGTPVTGLTPVISQAEADALMEADCALRVAAVRASLKVAAERSSTLLKDFNAGKPLAVVAAQFLEWDKERDPNTGDLVVSNGLHNRRVEESEVFLGKVQP